MPSSSWGYLVCHNKAKQPADLMKVKWKGLVATPARPAPDFISSESTMRVMPFAPRSCSQISRADKLRARFFHCILRWLIHDYMSNATLRERFSLAPDEFQPVSALLPSRLSSTASHQPIPTKGSIMRIASHIGRVSNSFSIVAYTILDGICTEDNYSYSNFNENSEPSLSAYRCGDHARTCPARPARPASAHRVDQARRHGQTRRPCPSAA